MKLIAFLNYSLFFSILATYSAYAASDDATAKVVDFVGNSKLLIVGEVHGTQEGPALIREISEKWTEAEKISGKPQLVIVALEYPQSEALYLQRYFESDGSPNEQEVLIKSPFWSRPFQDGRSSEAVFKLINSIRSQYRHGEMVQLVAIDMNEAQRASKLDRDKAMADNLRAFVNKNPDARIIALLGNYHARQSVGAPWNADFHFMASYLKDLMPFSLLLQARHGSYWGCSSNNAIDCKAEKLALGEGNVAPVGLYTDEDLKKTGYNEGLMVEKFSFSGPANKFNFPSMSLSADSK